MPDQTLIIIVLGVVASAGSGRGSTFVGDAAAGKPVEPEAVFTLLASLPARVNNRG